jgi:hypothetical protein
MCCQEVVQALWQLDFLELWALDRLAGLPHWDFQDLPLFKMPMLLGGLAFNMAAEEAGHLRQEQHRLAAQVHRASAWLRNFIETA